MFIEKIRNTITNIFIRRNKEEQLPTPTEVFKKLVKESVKEAMREIDKDSYAYAKEATEHVKAMRSKKVELSESSRFVGLVNITDKMLDVKIKE